MQLSRLGGAFQWLGICTTSGDGAAHVVDLQPRDRRSYWRVRCGFPDLRVKAIMMNVEKAVCRMAFAARMAVLRERQRKGLFLKMFEQAFRNIDDVLRKEAGCTTEL